jgi:hypothetical protein
LFHFALLQLLTYAKWWLALPLYHSIPKNGFTPIWSPNGECSCLATTVSQQANMATNGGCTGKACDKLDHNSLHNSLHNSSTNPSQMTNLSGAAVPSGDERCFSVSDAEPQIQACMIRSIKRPFRERNLIRTSHGKSQPISNFAPICSPCRVDTGLRPILGTPRPLWRRLLSERAWERAIGRRRNSR